MIVSSIIGLLLASSTPQGVDEASAQPSHAAPAADAALRAVALDRVFPYWDDYLDLPEDQRDAFQLRYEFSGPENWALWLEEPDGSLIRIGGWPEQFLTPPERQYFDQSARLHVETADAGGMSVNLTMIPSAPLAQTYEVAALEAGMSQAQSAMRSIAGVASIFAPRLDTVTFRFNGPAPEAVALLENGDRIDLPVEGSIVRFPARERRFRRAVSLEFGTTPAEARITPR